MKSMLITVLCAALMAAPAAAADKGLKAKGAVPDFEHKKAEMLQRIDRRMARDQEERACVQKAASPADLKACRDKFRAERQQDRQGQ